MHTALCLALLGAPSAAQQPWIALDASVGGTGSAQRAAVSAWYPVLRLTSRLHVGLAGRVSAYGGDPADYTNRGPVQAGLPASVTVDPAVVALNAAVFGELGLIHRIALGANLDLLGIATGPTRTVGSLVEKPQRFSYFRYGSADHGALNSEFFLSFRATARVRLRAGVSHYVTNYTVVDTAIGAAPESRYQRFETVPFLAVSLRL